VLIAHLPPESSYRRATAQHWTEELELHAVTVELLHALIAVVVRVAGGKRLKPLHVPRPGERRVPRAGHRMSLAALLGEEVSDGGEAG
jgi:hypothetical protein